MKYIMKIFVILAKIGSINIFFHVYARQNNYGVITLNGLWNFGFGQLHEFGVKGHVSAIPWLRCNKCKYLRQFPNCSEKTSVNEKTTLLARSFLRLFRVLWVCELHFGNVLERFVPLWGPVTHPQYFTTCSQFFHESTVLNQCQIFCYS